MVDNKKLAQDILNAVGGSENISYVTHCLTRLRINLKDRSIPNDEVIKAIPGVVMVVPGVQYQVVIGPSVDKVYAEFIELSGFKTQDSMNTEQSSQEKEALTWKKVLSAVLDYLAGSITPAIPAMLVSAIGKMLMAIFGPDMLNWIAEGSDAYILLDTVGTVAFYFFPCIVGYTASKKFGLSPVLGILYGSILIYPSIIEIAQAGGSFTVYGIPTIVQNYAGTLLPIVLTVWIATYIERFFKKIMPDVLRVMGVPVCTTIVILPLMFCILAPAGSFIGSGICNVIIAIGMNFGPLGAMIIGAVRQFLVMTGMHHVLDAQVLLLFADKGYDTVITLGCVASAFATAGMCLGFSFATKNKEQRSLAFSNFIAVIFGGVTEPAIYGTGLANRKPLIGMVAGGAIGALYASLAGARAVTYVPVANLLSVTTYVGDNNTNLLNGLISAVIAFAVSLLVTYVTCREKKKIMTNTP